MAKEREKFDSNRLREEEREVETKAAYAGKGMDDDYGDYRMGKVEKDNSEGHCQRVADEAQSYNENDESGSEHEEY